MVNRHALEDLELRGSIVASRIASIPSEILITIFTLVKTMDEIEHWSEKHLDWIKVTHVCRWWREVGTRVQCLWKDIPAFSKEWTEEMLKKSNKSSVTVSVDFTGPPAPRPSRRAARTILQYFSRIRELNLQGVTKSKLQDYLKPTISSEHPFRLHTLRISGCPNGYHNKMIVISDKTLPHGLDSLRRVSLSVCALDWDNASFLHNLTHIRAFSNPLDAPLKYGVKPLLEILRKMPALESIHFECFTESLERLAMEQLPSDYQTVSLPHLKILRLAVEMRHLETILPALDLPSDVSLKLYCYNPTESLSSFPRILSACSMHLQRPNTSNDSQSGIQSLEWFTYSQGEYRVRVWPTALSQEELNVMGKPPGIETVFSWDTAVELAADVVFQNLLRSFNLEHLVSLSISELGFIDCETWVTTFGTLPQLKYIVLGKTCSRGLLKHSYSESITEIRRIPDHPYLFPPCILSLFRLGTV